MMLNEMTPNWVRIILIALTTISFVPQLRLLWVRRSSAGISPFYVLFNLISATELFTISFYFLVNHIEPSDVFIHKPPTVGDWLNLAQLALGWVLWLVVFVTCLAFQSEDGRARLTASSASAIYVAFLLISIVPLFVDAAASRADSGYRKWGGAFFHGMHSIILNPIITILGIAALWAQYREILSVPAWPPSLSLSSLAAQAAVFAVLSLLWPSRLVFPWQGESGQVGFPGLLTWYQLVGFVAIDNAVLAVTQGILFWLASVRRRNGDTVTTLEETQSLLQN